MRAFQKEKAEEYLSGFLNDQVGIDEVAEVSGGCINEAYQLLLNDGRKIFCKVQRGSSFPGMFQLESKGLLELKKANAARIPEVIGFVENPESSYLFLEFIDSRSSHSIGQHNLGIQIARIHKVKSERFGWETDNYIGSLPQMNAYKDSWSRFYFENRLNFQLKMAIDGKKLDYSLVKHFDSLGNKLTEIFPDEKPSLLHGDLWSGNFLIDQDGKGVLFDPAVYYGHREMDLGMTKLFGGFSNEFYYAYNEYYPIEKGWQERIPVTQLYPLLVHVNLFGGGYAEQVKSIVKKY